MIYCLFLTQQSVLKEIILNLTFCLTFKTIHYSYKICCFSCCFFLSFFLFCFLFVFVFCCELARPLKPAHLVHIYNNHSSVNTGYNIVFTIITHSYFSQLTFSLLVTIFYMTTVPPPPQHPSTPHYQTFPAPSLFLFLSWKKYPFTDHTAVKIHFSEYKCRAFWPLLILHVWGISDSTCSFSSSLGGKMQHWASQDWILGPLPPLCEILPINVSRLRETLDHHASFLGDS